MKRFFITYLFAFVHLFSSAQILKKTFYDYAKTKPDEVYYINSAGQYNGLYTKYDYDGAKAFELNFSNGLKNGIAKEYYTRDGKSKLKITASYKDDEKHGHWITYTYVKDGEGYYDIVLNIFFNSNAKSVFNDGTQVKYKEEFFDNGVIIKEILYHITGKPFYTANFQERRYIGDYECYDIKSRLIAKGKINPEGKMIGLWIIPREEKGNSPKNKHEISDVIYTQKIKFDDNGNIDTNYISKSYYLSGKLKDSVRIISLTNKSGYDMNGIWFLCGSNKLLTGPYREFHESGKAKTEGQYGIMNNNQIKVGIWKYFDEKGILINEVDEDAIRMKAEEVEMEALRKRQEEEKRKEEQLEKERLEKEQAKKEAERLERERIEKELAAKEAKRLENEKLLQLMNQADSSISIEQNLYNEFEHASVTKYTSPPANGKYIVEHTPTSYVYVVSKKPDFYPHCQEIHLYYLTNIEKLKKDFNDNKIARNMSECARISNEIIILSAKHSDLNKKMILLAKDKTSKIEKLFKKAKNIIEKIEILSDYEID